MPLGTVFVGHTNTDMDSIASSIGAAVLFGGTAAAASGINSETEYALQRWNQKCPTLFAEMPDSDKTNICILDHNQTSQFAPGLDASNVVGLIDHHALQSSTITTDKPIYIDVRPWGSCCSIIAHTFFGIRKAIPHKLPGCC